MTDSVAVFKEQSGNSRNGCFSSHYLGTLTVTIQLASTILNTDP